MAQPAIQAEGLSKRYRLGTAYAQDQGRGGFLGRAIRAPLRYLLSSLRPASEAETLWALKDVSFTVEPGEVVGIIGHNGAGKTTLLRILSRITDPSGGRAVVRGRVGTLLQVGAGFHPELTGRENIFLNGAILGMRAAEIKERFAAIVEFAEVERFVDTPVKYYSSGMYVRLAFSVAAHLEPEILLVDEVLAVGDLAFQKKCLGKMGSVAGEGRTVLLVSHNMEAILGLCPRTIWIDGGRLKQDGPSREVVGAYSRQSLQAAESQDFSQKERSGEGVIDFTGLALRDIQGHPAQFAVCGEPIDLVLNYRTSGQALKNVSAWIWLRDAMGTGITCLWSRLTGEDWESVPAEGAFVCRVPRLNLAPGTYRIDINAVAAGHPSDKVLWAGKLEVVPGDFYGTGRPLNQVGLVLCDHTWSLEG